MSSYLAMRNIVKTYPSSGVTANDNVSIEVRRGEIHALMGENGAGKTTLMNILYGLERADSGTIWLEGAEIAVKSPLTAQAHGIGMVHQHFKLIKEFTVAQNLVLGREPKKGGIFFDNVEAEKAAAAVMRQNHLSIPPGKKVSELTIGQRQQVEIVKALYGRADILILDEPTSVLTEQEIKEFFLTLRGLAARGKTIILITHKLGEVKRISDRVTVMRRGRVAAVRTADEIDERELSRLMVGRPAAPNFHGEKGGGGEPIFILKDVSVTPEPQGRPILWEVNLSACPGEIVGVTGAAGNGLAELEDVIAGLMPISGGGIYYHDQNISRLSAPELRDLGFTYIPTDRLGRGASLTSSIQENIIVTNLRDYRGRAGMINAKKVSHHVQALMEKYQVDGDERLPIAMLSGGNIQRVILARELERTGDFILFAEPTWGLDAAAGEFIYEKLLALRRGGTAIILLSSNIDEVLALADRVAVMYRGRVVMNRRTSPRLTREFVGEYILGLKDDFPRAEKTLSDNGGESEN